MFRPHRLNSGSRPKFKTLVSAKDAVMQCMHSTSGSLTVTGCVCLSVCLSAYLPACMSVCVCVSVCALTLTGGACVCVRVSFWVCLPAYLSVCTLTLTGCVRVSVCLSVCVYLDADRLLVQLTVVHVDAEQDVVVSHRVSHSTSVTHCSRHLHTHADHTHTVAQSHTHTPRPHTDA